MTRVPVEAAVEQLEALVQAAINGEVVELVDSGGSSVRLVPSSPKARSRTFGSARGKIEFLRDDFDAPIEDFDEYTR